MKVYVAGDYLAWNSIAKVMEYVEAKGHEAVNIGAQSEQDQIGLAEFIPKACKQVLTNDESQGILLCGTGAGVEIGANRFKGIRASLCILPQQAEWARNKDNANVLCLSAWQLEESNNLEAILDVWFSTNYDGSEQRLKMLEDFDRF